MTWYPGADLFDYDVKCTCGVHITYANMSHKDLENFHSDWCDIAVKLNKDKEFAELKKEFEPPF